MSKRNIAQVGHEEKSSPPPAKRRKVDDDDDEDEKAEVSHFCDLVDSLVEEDVLFPEYDGERHTTAACAHSTFRIPIGIIRVVGYYNKFTPVDSITLSDYFDIDEQGPAYKLFARIFREAPTGPYTNEIASVAAPLASVLNACGSFAVPEKRFAVHREYQFEQPNNSPSKSNSKPHSNIPGAKPSADIVITRAGEPFVFECKNPAMIRKIAEALTNERRRVVEIISYGACVATLKQSLKDQKWAKLSTKEKRQDLERTFSRKEVDLALVNKVVVDGDGFGIQSVQRCISEICTNMLLADAEFGAIQCRNMGFIVHLKVLAEDELISENLDVNKAYFRLAFKSKYAFTSNPSSRHADLKVLLSIVERCRKLNTRYKPDRPKLKKLNEIVAEWGVANQSEPSAPDTSMPDSTPTSESGGAPHSSGGNLMSCTFQLRDKICHGFGFGAYKFIQDGEHKGWAKAVNASSTEDVDVLRREVDILQRLSMDEVFGGHVPRVLDSGPFYLHFGDVKKCWWGFVMEDVGVEPKWKDVDWEFVRRLKERCEELKIPHDFEMHSTTNLLMHHGHLSVIDFVS